MDMNMRLRIILIEQVTTVASDYQERVFNSSNTKKEFLVNCALLGFSPNCHICNLFYNHSLTPQENTLLVLCFHILPKLQPK